MSGLKFAEEDRKILNHERFYHPHPRVQRLWRFVKKKCLYGKYYEDFTQFSSTISGCLNDAHLQHKQELDSLLTLRFQHFDKAQIMNV
jgi:hypothetical protein